MSPCKGDILIFVDNKEQTWEPALSMTLLVFIYVQHIDMNIEQLSIPCSKKHNLGLKNILSSKNKSKDKSTFKSKKKSTTRCRCKYNTLDNLIFSYLYLSCFLLMLLTESCIFIFVCFTREYSISS